MSLRAALTQSDGLEVRLRGSECFLRSWQFLNYLNNSPHFVKPQEFLVPLVRSWFYVTLSGFVKSSVQTKEQQQRLNLWRSYGSDWEKPVFWVLTLIASHSQNPSRQHPEDWGSSLTRKDDTFIPSYTTYIGNNSTKSPASGVSNVSEPRLMSHVGSGLWDPRWRLSCKMRGTLWLWSFYIIPDANILPQPATPHSAQPLPCKNLSVTSRGKSIFFRTTLPFLFFLAFELFTAKNIKLQSCDSTL